MIYVALPSQSSKGIIGRGHGDTSPLWVCRPTNQLAVSWRRCAGPNPPSGLFERLPQIVLAMSILPDTPDRVFRRQLCIGTIQTSSMPKVPRTNREQSVRLLTHKRYRSLPGTEK